MKRVFAILFFLSLILFLVSFLLLKQILLNVVSLHVGLFSLAMYFLFEKDISATMRKLGIIDFDTKKIMFYTVGGFLAIIAILLILGIFFTIIKVEDRQNVENIVVNLPLSVILFAVFLAPISEELFFRGFLLSRFGISISTVTFALSHFTYQSIHELIVAFFIGYILALIFKSSKSILPCIFIHLLFNLLSVFIIRSLG